VRDHTNKDQGVNAVAQPSVLFVAVPAAVAGAAGFGLASALQHQAAREAPDTGVIGPRLLLELARRPRWLLATGAVAMGLALQLVALAFAPLALVQPLLVTGVLFGTVFAAWLARQRPDRLIVLGALAATGGLAAFLTLARPYGGRFDLPPLLTLLPQGAVLLAVVIGCLWVATRYSGPRRVGALALTTGVCYGVTAGLMKVVTGELRTDGFEAILTQPALYLVCVIGPAGFLLSQHTFQEGMLIAPALAIITIVDPLVGMGIGLLWLGEQLADTSAPVVAGELVAVLAIIAGVGLLAHRGTRIRAQMEAVSSSRQRPTD
jgi:drug/metabolite transporter (DMT)-like permease